MSKLDKDKLDIYVKKNKAELIEDCYSHFAWEKVSTKENDRFEDLVDISFERPHKIPHKDDLQLMQVHMEHYLNDIGVLEHNKHSKSMAMSLILGFLSFAIMILGVALIIDLSSILYYVLGGIVCACGLVLAIFVPIITTRLIRKENKIFDSKYKDLNSKLKNLCTNAKRLVEDNNEQIK